jgi:AraC-like DNA-binding protein
MSTFQKSSFTTQYLHPDQQLGVWKESIDALFDVTPAPQSSSSRCHTSVTSFLIDNQFMFSGCSTHAQRFERQPLRVARDDLDYYVVQTHLSGAQEITHGSAKVSCKPGDLLVLDMADKHEATTTAFTQRSLVIPRHMLTPHLSDPDSQAGRVLKAASPLTALAVNHIKTAFNLLSDMTEEEAQQLIKPTVLLVAGALNGSLERVPDSGAALTFSLLAQAKVEIENNLQRNINVDKLCASLKHSRSALYRLFEPIGGIRAYIQERRLRRSAQELLSDKLSNKRICDIAYTWGFASEAHYSRAFRLRFGMTPSEAKAYLPETYPADHEAIRTEVGDRDYERWLSETLRM